MQAFSDADNELLRRGGERWPSCHCYLVKLARGQDSAKNESSYLLSLMRKKWHSYIMQKGIQIVYR